MGDPNAHDTATRIAAMPIPDQLRLAAEMYASSQDARASGEHIRAMLALTQQTLANVTKEVGSQLALMGFDPRPKQGAAQKKGRDW